MHSNQDPVEPKINKDKVSFVLFFFLKGLPALKYQLPLFYLCPSPSMFSPMMVLITSGLGHTHPKTW